LARVAQVDVEVNQAGADHQAGAVDPLGASKPRAKGGDAAVADGEVGGGIDAMGGVDDAAVLLDEIEHRQLRAWNVAARGVARDEG